MVGNILKFLVYAFAVVIADWMLFLFFDSAGISSGEIIALVLTPIGVIGLVAYIFKRLDG
jgi:hypothetical protein